MTPPKNDNSIPFNQNEIAEQIDQALQTLEDTFAELQKVNAVAQETLDNLQQQYKELDTQWRKLNSRGATVRIRASKDDLEKIDQLTDELRPIVIRNNIEFNISDPIIDSVRELIEVLYRIVVSTQKPLWQRGAAAITIFVISGVLILYLLNIFIYPWFTPPPPECVPCVTTNSYLPSAQPAQWFDGRSIQANFNAQQQEHTILLYVPPQGIFSMEVRLESDTPYRLFRLELHNAADPDDIEHSLDPVTGIGMFNIDEGGQYALILRFEDDDTGQDMPPNGDVRVNISPTLTTSRCVMRVRNTPGNTIRLRADHSSESREIVMNFFSLQNEMTVNVLEYYDFDGGWYLIDIPNVGTDSTAWTHSIFLERDDQAFPGCSPRAHQ